MVKHTASPLNYTFCKLVAAGLGLLPLAASAQTITAFTPSKAAPGATVTITGSGLATTASVNLNGQLMPVASKNAFSVTVTVPAAASTGKLRLTTASGGTVLSSTALGVTRTSSKLTATLVEQGATTTANISAPGSYSTPTAADLNNDGLLELVVGDGNGNLEVYSKSSASSTKFTSLGSVTANGTTIKVTNYAKPCVADLDGDGLLELIVGTGTSQGLMCYEQLSASSLTTFGAGVALTTKASATATAASMAFNNFPKACVSDLDRNGLLDLLVGDYSGYIYRFEQSAANSRVFVTMGTLKDGSGAAITTGSDTVKPSIIDLDGDGYLDLVIGSHDGSVRLYTQTALLATTFSAVGNLTTNGTTAVSMSSYGGYAAPAITDYDGDGLLDFFFGNGNGTLYRYEQSASTTSPTLTAPLPVVLASFTGQAASAGNQLTWITASEANSAYFGVERSADGSTFAEVGRVAAAGASATARTYRYLDAAAPAGTSYYRLHQVDLDGTSTYSPVLSLDRAATEAAKPQAFPTAFDQELHVLLPQASMPQVATAQLLTLDGRVVYTAALELDATPRSLPGLPALAPACYLLRIATPAGSTTQRVRHL